MTLTDHQAPERTRRVRPWIAGALSFFTPGLGQFYAGRSRRAAVWIGAFAGLAVATPLLSVLIGEYVFALTAGVFIPLWLASVIDAVAVAARNRRVPRSGPARLLGCVVVVGVWIGAATAMNVLAPFRTFYLPGESMRPTIDRGERMLVRMRSPICPRLTIERGDLVLLETETPAGRAMLVRRVVGLAGDRVVVDESGLKVNGERLTQVRGDPRSIETRRGLRVTVEPADEHVADSRAWRVYAVPDAAFGPWGPSGEFGVGPGEVFLLGDNRANSHDSRMDGPARLDAVAGKPVRLLWSPGPSWLWRDLRVNAGPDCATS